jgi:hypothetical protein
MRGVAADGPQHAAHSTQLPPPAEPPDRTQPPSSHRHPSPDHPVPNPTGSERKEPAIVSAMHDHHGDATDDTADLGPPIHPSLGYGLDSHPETTQPPPVRLRPASRVRQVHGITMAACYAATLGTLVWLLVEALLHAELLIMLLSVGLLVWLAPQMPSLWRWLRSGSNTGQAVPLSWLVQLVVTAITALNLFLLVYAHV